MKFAEESFAREVLERTRATPQMWAATKDGFITRVGTILEMVGSNPRPFYDHLYKAKFFRVGQSKDDFDDIWAHAVIDLSKAYLVSTQREQKLVDITFELVAMVTDPQFLDHFQKLGLKGRMEYVANQLKQCGFPTHPVGASWGSLDKPD